MKHKQPITEALRRVMLASGESHLGISKATGVPRPSIIRFLRGEQSLRLDMADRLAQHFGLELVSLTPKSRKAPS